MFSSYRMDHQFDVIRLVGELTDVPVPRVRWLEPTGKVLGTPFFLMDHVVGRRAARRHALHLRRQLVRRRARRAAARTAGRHRRGAGQAALDPAAPSPPSGSWPTVPRANALRRHLDWLKAWYEFAVPDIGRSAAGRAGPRSGWRRTSPTTSPPTDPVLVWGDSRIGNVLYEDFRPVAVLDWEMATLGTARTGRGVDDLRAHGLPGARRPGRHARAARRHA